MLNIVCSLKTFGAEESSANVLELQNLLELPMEELLQLSVLTTTRTPMYSRALPFKVTIISREEIQQQLALTSDTSQILANLIPGFSPSQQKLSGRGENLRGRNQLMMVDGIPQSNPLRDSARDSYSIDLEMVERIEVIYGASAIQGMGASGGIINFITSAPGKNKSTQLVTKLAANDQFAGDSLGYKLGVQHQQQFGKLSLLLAGSWETRGLYYDGNNRPLGLEQIQGDLMDTRSQDILLKVGYAADQQRIQLTYHDYEIASQGDFVNVPGNISQEILASSRPGQIPGAPPGNKVKFTAIDYSHTNIAEGSLAFKLFQQEFAATFGALETAILQDPSLGDNLIDQSQIKSDKWGAKLSYSTSDLGGHPLDITTGTDYLCDNNIQVLLMTDRIWSPRMHFESWAPFVEGEYRLGKNTIISAGLRRELADLNVGDYRTIATSNNTFVMGGELTFDETQRNLGVVYH
jgi:iron complex outermembrane receptor protein